MPWVRFTDDFDFMPPSRNGSVVIAYKRGMVQLVTQVCASIATADDKAVMIERSVDGDKRQRREIPQADD